MRERREISTRADASLLRNWRIDIRVEQLEEKIDELRSSAGVTLGNDIGAQQHHRPHFPLRKPVADTRRVAAHEVHLQLGQLLVWNGNFGKFPEAGRHSVDDFVPADDVVNDRAGAQHSLARFWREADAQTLDGDGVGFINGERVAIDEQLLAHFFFRARLRAFNPLAAGCRLAVGRLVLAPALAALFFFTLLRDFASDEFVTRRSFGSQRQPFLPGPISTPPSQRDFLLMVCQSFFPARTSRPRGVSVSSLSTNSREIVRDGATTGLPVFRVTSG